MEAMIKCPSCRQQLYRRAMVLFKLCEAIGEMMRETSTLDSVFRFVRLHKTIK